MNVETRDPLGIVGHFHLQAFDADGNLVAEVDEPNLIYDQGLQSLADALLLPGFGSGRTFYAIQIGDNGALSTDPMIPKVLDPTAASPALFHEIGSRTVGDFASTQVAGSAPGLNNAVKCQQTFTAADFDDADFLDSSKKFINEAMLFLGKAADASSAWEPFAGRTFKSIPFGPADAVTAVIRWTFELQRGTV